MFSLPGTYPAVGLFSTAHIISIFVCFSLIALAVYLTRKMKSETYFKMIRVFAVVIPLLELFKICWNLINGITNIDSWLPLYFCSLFIYALWFASSKNEKVREFGMSFISLANIVAGTVFIISPSTSFSTYPIFHFQCIYSMIFHSSMVYLGIMSYVTKSVKIDFRLVLNYLIYCAIFMTIAIIVNVVGDANMMFISNPYNIPLPILHTIYDNSHILYSIIIIVAHMLIGFVVWGIYLLCTIKSRKQSRISELNPLVDDEDMEEKHT